MNTIFKGINTISFNQATMNQIVLHYFKTVMLKDVPENLFVTNVKEDSKSFGSSFVITFQVEEKDTK